MVKKKYESWLEKGFYEGVDYIGESKNYIYLIVILFFWSAGIGFFFYEQFTFIDQILRELLGVLEGKGTADLISFIFVNNVKSSFFGLVFGAIFGVVSIAVAVLNGIILGYVFQGVWQISGFSDWWRILPHGVFELPAVFISLGLGLKLGLSFFDKNWGKEFFRRFVEGMKAFLLIVVPLLVVAAIIEGVLIGLGI